MVQNLILATLLLVQNTGTTFSRLCPLSIINILFQDLEMQALFKNDQFSVEGELARRGQVEERGLVNPAITRQRCPEPTNFL